MTALCLSSHNNRSHARPQAVPGSHVTVALHFEDVTETHYTYSPSIDGDEVQFNSQPQLLQRYYMVHNLRSIRGIRCANYLFVVEGDLDFNKTDTIFNLECTSTAFHASIERRKTRGAEDALRNAAKRHRSGLS